VSPAAGFGGYAPGERTGCFRIGGDVLLADAEGNSFVSGEDFAIAFVDEIDTPVHHASASASRIDRRSRTLCAGPDVGIWITLREKIEWLLRRPWECSREPA